MIFIIPTTKIPGDLGIIKTLSQLRLWHTDQKCDVWNMLLLRKGSILWWSTWFQSGCQLGLCEFVKKVSFSLHGGNKNAKRSIAEDQTILDDFHQTAVLLAVRWNTSQLFFFTNEKKKSYKFIFISAIKRDSKRIVKSMKMGFFVT